MKRNNMDHVTFEIRSLMAKHGATAWKAIADELSERKQKTSHGKRWTTPNLTQYIKRKNLTPFVKEKYTPVPVNVTGFAAWPPAPPSEASSVLKFLVTHPALNDTQRVKMINAYLDAKA